MRAKTRDAQTVNRTSSIDEWIEQETAECRFKDERLLKRLHKLLEMTSNGVGQSIPCACRDWANTKAAYRFFANESVTEEEILAGHFQATRERLAAAAQRILIRRS